MTPDSQPLLAGKRGIVFGVANEQSIAFGCAKAFRRFGAELALTYLNEKARRFVEPCAAAVDARLLLPCDVTRPGDMEAVFAAVREQWGGIDFALHSIAFAPKDDLHGPLLDSSRDGFLTAMDVSCHSFIRMARLAVPLMPEGGVLLTMTYYGAEKVVDHYNLMGPVKAALEASVRYLAAELGERGVRVHAISPGPIRTRAASGIEHFDVLLDQAAARTPMHRLVSIEDVGTATALMASDAARLVTGDTLYVDGGYHVVG